MDEMYKCGYCGYLLQLYCDNLLDHKCIREKYIEGEHELVEDEMKVLTLVSKTTNETVGASQIQAVSLEEELIRHVQERPALYNFGLPLSERTNARKAALWREIFNIFGGKHSVEDLQKKWKYLRDSYVRAKKKVTQYKPSGSEATAPTDPGFRFYEAMRFIDDGANSQTTVCSLSPPNSASNSRAEGSISGNSQVHTPLTSPDVITPTKRKKTKDKNQSDAENEILSALLAPPSKLDGVDGFLIRLGESLRRLPYRQRCEL